MATMKDIKDKVAKIATSLKNKFGVGSMAGMDAIAAAIDNIPTHAGGTYKSNQTVNTAGKYVTDDVKIDIPTKAGDTYRNNGTIRTEGYLMSGDIVIDIPTKSGVTVTSNGIVSVDGYLMSGNIFVDVPQTVHEETLNGVSAQYDTAELKNGYWNFKKTFTLKDSNPQIKSAYNTDGASGYQEGNKYVLLWENTVPDYAYESASDALRGETFSYEIVYYYLT